MPNLNTLLSQAFNGLALGSLLALVASGLTIVLGTLGVLNFAHGALFMLGAYATFALIGFGVPYALAVAGSCVAMLAVGLLLEWGLIRRFYHRPHEDQILVTFGIGIVLVEIIRAGFGGNSQRLPVPSWGEGVMEIGFLFYPTYRLQLIGIIGVLLVGLYLVLYRTSLGLVVRAGIENTGMVGILGINVRRTFLAVFALGVMAAGLAGALYAPIVAVNPEMGASFMVQSFVVIVIGGLGSFPGAVVGGLIAGEIISLTSAFDASYSEVMLYAVMALLLVVRPKACLVSRAAYDAERIARRVGRIVDMKPILLMAVALVIGGLVFPHVGGSWDMMVRILVWGLMGLGFDILFGFTGLLSFGSAAFFGTGGFVTGLLLVRGAIDSFWLGLLGGTLAAGLLGAALGLLAVRRIGIYFTMITLAFGQMAYFLENGALSGWTGGENGLPGVPLPSLFGHKVAPGPELYTLIAVLFLLGYALARRIVHSPFGLVLAGIKGNTARAAMLGHDVPRYKLAAFVIAALYSGFAGGLLGSIQSYMPPDAFALDTSGQLVVQTIIGGVGTLVGPLVGAVVWLWLRDLLQLVPGMGALWRLVLGIVFIVLVVFLRRGIWGEFLHLRRNRATIAPAPAGESAPHIEPPLRAPALVASAPALAAEGLCKYYGGLKAVDGVSFTVQTGTIHGVIGPNGAGKSTLFKMLLDEIRPTKGQVHLFGQRITGLGATRTATLGIGKSNQLNQLFLDLTVRENLRLAALARARGAFRLDALRDASGIADVEHQVDAVLGTVDLGERAGVPAGLLAYGEKRRLEIGLALATGPNVLLLDEPLAGMSPAERIATRALIREIGRTRTLVVVEHDMDAVFEMADRITVLQEGRLLAEGSPTQIQADARVQAAYLGGFAAEVVAA